MRTFTTVFKFITISLYITDIRWSRGSPHVISCLNNDCQNTSIHCPNDNDDCFVSCTTTRGCQNAIINCPIQQECVILCDDIESCKGSTINATHSSILDITGCIQDQSCFDLSIYCPQNTENQRNCLIEGNDNLGSSIIIHAVYGWNQLDIQYDGTFNNTIDGTLYCNTDYDTSCDIASDEWSCIDIDNECNNILSITTTQNTETDTNTTPIDTEMMIIISTLIAAFCFITICCWLNRYKQSNVETTTMAKKKGEDQKLDITVKHTKKSLSHSKQDKTSKPSAPIKTIQKNTHKSRERVSTNPTDTTYSTVPPVESTNNKVDTNNNERNMKNTSRKRTKTNESVKYENDLEVISEQHPAPTNTDTMVYNTKPKQLAFKPNISDSETMKSTAETWDNFDQENGILADRRNMNQMMGFLEEGAIACSYE